MIYELIAGVPTQMVEICLACGCQPQAPSWDQCYGCGQAATPRTNVPASECERYGMFGIRWTKFAVLSGAGS